MELLTQLGINSMLFAHMACFVLAYLALSQLVFKPYMSALKEREARTVGSEENASRVLDEAAQIQAEFETKAKQISGRIRSEYDKSRSEAMRAYDQMVATARQEATQEIEKARQQIAREMSKAQQSLVAEVPTVTATIASKMAGKEISL
jgi:F-type H+-transporting ATPase subunit b